MQQRMITIRNILCPLDLSETSEVALGYAVMLSRWYGAALTALEVIWLGVPPVSPARASPVLTPAQVDEYSSELRQFVAAKVPSGCPGRDDPPAWPRRVRHRSRGSRVTGGPHRHGHARSRRI